MSPLHVDFQEQLSTGNFICCSYSYKQFITEETYYSLSKIKMFRCRKKHTLVFFIDKTWIRDFLFESPLNETPR